MDSQYSGFLNVDLAEERRGVAEGSWLCRNALPEVSKRSSFGRVALKEPFFGFG